MKKRYIAIIAASTVTLLFGSLIYCGITAFPELLKAEEETKEIEMAPEVELETPIFEDEFPQDIVEDVPQVVTIIDAPTFDGEEFYISDFDAENVDVVILENDDVALSELEDLTVEEPVIEETIVEEAPVFEEHFSYSYSPIAYRVTFVCEHCSVIVNDEKGSDLVTTIEDSNLDFEIICEEGYTANLDDVTIDGVLGEDLLELNEDNSHISDIKSDIVVTIEATQIGEESLLIYEHDEEAEVVPVIEKRELAEPIFEQEGGHKEIIEATIMVVGIVEVLSVIFLRHKKKRFVR